MKSYSAVCELSLAVKMKSPPSAQWIAQQLIEAYGWKEPPRYLIRDRDSAYGEAFVRRIRAIGIRDRPISARSPWQNGYVERLIGSIRQDCLDHVVVLGERHLRHLFQSYQKYHNDVRTHLSLHKDAPVPREVRAAGHVLAVPILGRATPSICSSLSLRQGQQCPLRESSRAVAQSQIQCVARVIRFGAPVCCLARHEKQRVDIIATNNRRWPPDRTNQIRSIFSHHFFSDLLGQQLASP